MQEEAEQRQEDAVHDNDVVLQGDPEIEEN